MAAAAALCRLGGVFESGFVIPLVARTTIPWHVPISKQGFGLQRCLRGKQSKINQYIIISYFSFLFLPIFVITILSRR
jgi:hypothetical protein